MQPLPPLLGQCDPVEQGVPAAGVIGDSAPAAGALASSSREAVGHLELPGTGPGGSIAAVLQKRLEHIGLGYGPEHDAQLPDAHLAKEAHKYAGDAVDLILRHDDAARIRLKLVNGAALLLAAIDRLDAQFLKEHSHHD